MTLDNSVYDLSFDTMYYVVDQPVFYLLTTTAVSGDLYTTVWNTVWSDVTECIDMMLDSNIYACAHKIIENYEFTC